jgi:hypothetical protein
MKAISLVLVPLFACLVACSGGSGGSGKDADSPEGAEGEGEKSGEPGEPESEYDRKLRLAKERREQCESLAVAVQAAEKPGQHIVNLNDESKLESLAKEIDGGLDGVKNLKLTIEDLETLRTRYLTAAQDLSGALHEAAKTPDDKKKKAALARYNKIDTSTDTLIEEINWACGEGEGEEEQEGDRKNAPPAGGKAAPKK